MIPYGTRVPAAVRYSCIITVLPVTHIGDIPAFTLAKAGTRFSDSDAELTLLRESGPARGSNPEPTNHKFKTLPTCTPAHKVTLRYCVCYPHDADKECGDISFTVCHRVRKIFCKRYLLCGLSRGDAICQDGRPEEGGEVAGLLPFW